MNVTKINKLCKYANWKRGCYIWIFIKNDLINWFDINSFEPVTLKEIINQSITENIYIRVDNKPIKANFLGIQNKTILNYMNIKDIIENNWKIGKKKPIEHELNEKISIPKYLSLIKAIPPKMEG